MEGIPGSHAGQGGVELVGLAWSGAVVAFLLHARTWEKICLAPMPTKTTLNGPRWHRRGRRRHGRGRRRPHGFGRDK
jgi:hypothetical protein